MWKNGSTARMRVWPPIRMIGSDCTMLATRLRCVSITPLALPVVPEEYGSTATSSAGSITTSGTGPVLARSCGRFGCPSAPSRTTTSSAVRPICWAAGQPLGSSTETVNSILAPASASWLATSFAVYSALIVVAVAPARRMPWKTTA